MILSVMIPSVPSRHVQACALFDKISKQAEGYDVEVLMLCDNKKRSVGLKRQALLDVSKGEWVAFVDDDDDVMPSYIESLAKTLVVCRGLGVVVFDTLVTLNDGADVVCSHNFQNENEQYNPEGFKRGAWQMHAWPGAIARRVSFPDNTGHEDWPWCEEMAKRVQWSIKIPMVLYHYRFNDKTTEASNVQPAR